jgi:hypothetical protein
LWIVCGSGIGEVMQRVFGGVFKKREEDGLPEYEWVA